MPRVERGWWLLESYKIIELLHSDASLAARIPEFAYETGATIVTRPGSLTVYTSTGPLDMGLGIGSIIAPEKPPWGGLEVSRPEWVDGCRATSPPSLPKPPRDVDIDEVDDIIVAVEWRDPAALFLNGLKTKMTIAVWDPGSLPPLAVVGEKPILYGRFPEYVHTIVEGDVKPRADYIIALLSTCREE